MKHLFTLLLAVPLFLFSCNDQSEVPTPTALKAESIQNKLPADGSGADQPLNVTVLVYNQFGQPMSNALVKIEKRMCEYDFTSAAQDYRTDAYGRIILTNLVTGFWQFWASGECYTSPDYTKSCYHCMNFASGGTHTVRLYVTTSARY